MVQQNKKAVIIGDSSYNTFSVIRSLGAARVSFVLLLIGEEDCCFVGKSKFVRRNKLIRLANVDDCKNALSRIDGGSIICTFDAAAEWVDVNEKWLSKRFVTPCRGKRIGNLFNKEAQCKLAVDCGLTVPKSTIINWRDDINAIPLQYPLIIKPLYSTKGEKSDIHICQNSEELRKALEDSICEDYVAQEFIDKEYELDCIGISTDDEVIIAGAVQKIRHYPHLIGAGAYGLFKPIGELDIDMKGVIEFIRSSNYHGPFSVEFLHSKGKNYFMEVNFRNEGLAQVATVAGANLHALYVYGVNVDLSKLKRVYMMNYSIDYLHVIEGRVGKIEWWHDFLRTRCFINFSPSDPMPTLCYYKSKFSK